MEILTKAVRKRLEAFGLFSQLNVQNPAVLLQLSTSPSGDPLGCGPWKWWVLGAEKTHDHREWLFAGIMSNHDRLQAGLFSMIELLSLDEVWDAGLTREDCDPVLDDQALRVWREVEPASPKRIMEATPGEIMRKCRKAVFGFEQYPWFQ